MHPNAEPRRMRSFRVFAALLHYPDAALQVHASELCAPLHEEGLLLPREIAAIEAFIERLAASALLELQSEYVETFDRGRARSLYLFEQVYGESRDRGQAMVELAHLYRGHGLVIEARELPDYLPLYLEFLSQLEADAALEHLAEVGELLQRLHARLAERESPYADLLTPLVRLSGVDDDSGLAERISAEPADDTCLALDRVWQEAPVTFGSGRGCGAAGEKGIAQPVYWYSPPGNRERDRR